MRIASTLRPAMLAAAMLTLLALVALASRSDASRSGDSDARLLRAAVWDYLVTLSLLAALAVLVLAAFLRLPVRHPRDEDRLLGLLVIAALCGFVALAATRLDLTAVVTRGDGEVLPGLTGEGVIQQTGERGRSEGSSRAPEPAWPIVFGAGALVLVALGIYLARRRLRAGGVLAPASAAAALSQALDDSLDDLRAERDPRRAVIAAYARMERVLDHHGLPRFRAEAPLEYLARVLRELSVRSAAVLALTELFERAKFSRHEIDVEMKEEAIGALVAVRNDLRTAA